MKNKKILKPIKINFYSNPKPGVENLMLCRLNQPRSPNKRTLNYSDFFFLRRLNLDIFFNCRSRCFRNNFTLRQLELNNGSSKMYSNVLCVVKKLARNPKKFHKSENF